MKRYPDTFIVRLSDTQMKFLLKLVYEKSRKKKRHVTKSSRFGITRMVLHEITSLCCFMGNEGELDTLIIRESNLQMKFLTIKFVSSIGSKNFAANVGDELGSLKYFTSSINTQ